MQDQRSSGDGRPTLPLCSACGLLEATGVDSEGRLLCGGCGAKTAEEIVAAAKEELRGLVERYVPRLGVQALQPILRDAAFGVVREFGEEWQLHGRFGSREEWEAHRERFRQSERNRRVAEAPGGIAEVLDQWSGQERVAYDALVWAGLVRIEDIEAWDRAGMLARALTGIKGIGARRAEVVLAALHDWRDAEALDPGEDGGGD
jgi:hypothetical protein